MDRLFGLERWHAFGVSPAWVDERKAPGRTSLLRSGYGDTQRSLLSVATLEFFFLSPNLAWFAWTVAAYWAFPYDADLDLASRPRHWLLRRCAVNVCGTLLFSLFWSVSLYRLQLSRRKFSPDSLPTRALFLHNVFYTAVGALVCSAWETALLQLWATGALPHISDADVRASPALMAYCVAYALAIPLLREVHFYFSHRLLHLRALYRMCHSLHHRNTDVEPFSGLAMHPVEVSWTFVFAPLLRVLSRLSLSPFTVTEARGPTQPEGPSSNHPANKMLALQLATTGCNTYNHSTCSTSPTWGFASCCRRTRSTFRGSCGTCW